MTQPTPKPVVPTIEPSKAKTWWAAAGSLLTVAVPFVLSVSESLPQPWPAIIGGVIGLLTVAGVYKAPYKPEGTSVVATSDLRQVAVPLPPTATGEHQPPPTPITPPPPRGQTGSGGHGGYDDPWS